MRKSVIYAAGAAIGLATLSAQAQQAQGGAETGVEARGATDGAIAGELEGSLEGRDGLMNVSQKVRHGVVTLTGTVPSDAARQNATRIAERIDGVTSVQNRLAVAAQASDQAAGSDDSMSASATVAAKLEQNGEVDAGPIDVEAISAHAVRLTGVVDTQAEKQHASAVAARTDVVDFVRNELDVGGN